MALSKIIKIDQTVKYKTINKWANDLKEKFVFEILKNRSLLYKTKVIKYILNTLEVAQDN